MSHPQNDEKDIVHYYVCLLSAEPIIQTSVICVG